MTTLHIQHPVSDFETWSSAFDRFADIRRRAGVVSQRVQRPIDDPKFVVIDLDFETSDGAKAFLDFLKTNVWAVKENAPALVGEPETMILEAASPQ